MNLNTQIELQNPLNTSLWNANTEEKLIQLKNQFPSAHWKVIAEKLNDCCGTHFTSKQCQSKWFSSAKHLTKEELAKKRHIENFTQSMQNYFQKFQVKKDFTWNPSRIRFLASHTHVIKRHNDWKQITNDFNAHFQTHLTPDQCMKKWKKERYFFKT